jgi:hypothetical protein
MTGTAWRKREKHKGAVLTGTGGGLTHPSLGGGSKLEAKHGQERKPQWGKEPGRERSKAGERSREAEQRRRW